MSFRMYSIYDDTMHAGLILPLTLKYKWKNHYFQLRPMYPPLYPSISILNFHRQNTSLHFDVYIEFSEYKYLFWHLPDHLRVYNPAHQGHTSN